MGYVVNTQLGISGNPEFMYFVGDSTLFTQLTFNKPTFEFNPEKGNLKGGTIRIYERGVLHPRTFVFSDFLEIDSVEPTSTYDAFNKLNDLRRTME